MMGAAVAAQAEETERLVEQYLQRSQGNALAALRQAISEALVDAVEFRQKLAAAERVASRGFTRQLPMARRTRSDP